jgi:hypothetical protein
MLFDVKKGNIKISGMEFISRGTTDRSRIRWQFR